LIGVARKVFAPMWRNPAHQRIFRDPSWCVAQTAQPL
jgi:hypothetical protein